MARVPPHILKAWLLLLPDAFGLVADTAACECHPLSLFPWRSGDGRSSSTYFLSCAPMYCSTTGARGRIDRRPQSCTSGSWTWARAHSDRTSPASGSLLSRAEHVVDVPVYSVIAHRSSSGRIADCGLSFKNKKKHLPRCRTPPTQRGTRNIQHISSLPLLGSAAPGTQDAELQPVTGHVSG